MQYYCNYIINTPLW